MAVVNVTAPTISGTAQQGLTLRCSNGTWTFDLDYLTYAYQWERCDGAGASCVDIAGATNSFYVLQNTDVGSTIRAEVTATEHSNPVGDLLPWAPPTPGDGGVAIVNWTMTNANRQSNSLLSGGGRDLVITSGEVLTGPVAQLNGWRHIIWIGGEFNITSPTDTAQLPLSSSGTIHLEGLYIHGGGVSDAMVARANNGSCTIQVQNCRTEVHFAGEPHEHADCFQTQVNPVIANLRFSTCTFVTNYQGFFLRPEGVAAFVTNGDFRSINFLREVPGVDPQFAYLFMADEDPSTGRPTPAIGMITMNDVWMEHNPSSTQNIYPDKIFSDAFGPGGPYVNRYGIFQESDGIGTYYRPAQTSDVVPPGGSASGQSCKAPVWSGIVRVGVPSGGDFCPVGVPGMGYVSPGYV